VPVLATQGLSLGSPKLTLGDENKYLNNKTVFSKKNFLFLLTIVSFLKKTKNIELFFNNKKQNKKSNSSSSSFNISSLLLGEPYRSADFVIREKEVNSFSELLFSSKKFLAESPEVFLNKNRTKFLFENSINQFLFSKKNMVSKKNHQDFCLQVSNKLIESKKQKIHEKKQKKLQEFLRSGFVLDNINEKLKFKNRDGKESTFSASLSKKTFSSPNSEDEDVSNRDNLVGCSGPFLRRSKKNETSKFLKNPVLTMSYNFLWKNDSDWKYFVYYNSLFFSEFEDIPINERVQTSSFQQSSPFVELGQSLSPETPLPRSQESSYLYRRTLEEKNQLNSFFLSSSFEKSQKHIQVGAGILEKLLTEYTPTELKKMIKQHQILLPKINQVLHSSKQILVNTKKESLKIQKYIQKREHIVRRLKFLRKFFRKNSNPTFMILRNLPVLPPDLRPILKLQNQIAASDLNRFYQRIIYRNERLKKFSKDSATNQSFEMRYAQRLLQEAVDNLIQNGKGGVKPETNSRGIPLKSLSEILKGKQGRFRQYLLGKRVDYSGRSVIVVGPKLKLYECVLPKEMAFELF
jgi:DNA-directed RNA polymerase beta' subunit